MIKKIHNKIYHLHFKVCCPVSSIFTLLCHVMGNLRIREDVACQRSVAEQGHTQDCRSPTGPRGRGGPAEGKSRGGGREPRPGQEMLGHLDHGPNPALSFSTRKGIKYQIKP